MSHRIAGVAALLTSLVAATASAEYADFSAGNVTGDMHVTERWTDQNPAYGGSHRLLWPGRSNVTAEFSLDSKPSAGTLKVQHLTSSSGPHEGYSPITITVNGKTVADHYSPGASNYIWDSYDVTDALDAGDNEISIAFDDDAATHYWLRRIELERTP